MKKVIYSLLKFVNKFYYIILFILFLLTICTLYQAIFIGKAFNNNELSPFVLIILSTVYLSFLIFIRKKLDKLNIKRSNLIAFIICVLSFIIMLIYMSNIIVLPNRDLTNIVSEANLYLQSGKLTNINYFSRYPFQLGILSILVPIFRLAKLLNINYLYVSSAFSAMSVCVSMYFAYLSIKKLTNYKNALFFLLFMILNPIFYVLFTFFYTDIFVLPFMSISIWLIISNMYDNGQNLNIKSIIKYVLIGTFSYIGFTIRGTAFIVLIAYFIQILFSNNNIRERLYKILFIVLGILISSLLVSAVLKPYRNDIVESRSFSFAHNVMMGLNLKTNGMWNQEDYNYSASFLTTEEKRDNDIIEIKRRLADMSLKEFFDLQYNKLRITWSYGDSAYSTYYNVVYRNTKLYDYIAGNKSIIITYILQVNRILLLFLLSYSIIKELINKNRIINFIYISIFGVFLLFAFWEAYPRYSMCFIPLLMIASSIHFESLLNVVDSNYVLSIGKHRLACFDNIKRVVSNVVIIATIILLIINYGYYVKEKSSTRVRSVYSIINNSDKVFYFNSANEIKQTFSNKLKFNSIIVKLIKEEKIDGDITLKLYDGDHLLYSKKKSISNVNSNSYVEFKLNKKYKSGNYLIVISTNIEEDNVLGLLGTSSSGYDYLPTGNLKIGDKELAGDLQLNVNNHVEKSILSAYEYLLLGMGLIVVELICFKKIKKDSI